MKKHPVVEPLAQAISDIARSVNSPIPGDDDEDGNIAELDAEYAELEAYDMLTDRQAASRYHIEEEANERDEA